MELSVNYKIDILDAIGSHFPDLLEHLSNNALEKLKNEKFNSLSENEKEELILEKLLKEDCFITDEIILVTEIQKYLENLDIEKITDITIDDIKLINFENINESEITSTNSKLIEYKNKCSKLKFEIDSNIKKQINYLVSLSNIKETFLSKHTDIFTNKLNEKLSLFREKNSILEKGFGEYLEKSKILDKQIKKINLNKEESSILDKLENTKEISKNTVSEQEQILKDIASIDIKEEGFESFINKTNEFSTYLLNFIDVYNFIELLDENIFFEDDNIFEKISELIDLKNLMSKNLNLFKIEFIKLTKKSNLESYSKLKDFVEKYKKDISKDEDINILNCLLSMSE